VIDRPRFLGLREFGPRNILYHEGRKYRMARVVLPTGGVQARLERAKFCRVCGYFHEGDHVGADLCNHCKSTLNMENSEFVPFLFEMATVKGIRVDRITCDEEERTREGYELELYYRFATGTDGKEVCDRATASSPEGVDLLHLTHGPQADLWRVNRKWRRSDQRGFSMDSKTGFWVRRPGDDDRAGEIDPDRLVSGITPFVWDTRNLLLISPEVPAEISKDDREPFLASLSYALQRGCQVFFQVEEQEISVQRIGAKDQERIMFWEASEGGNGVWPRLLEEPQSIARVAKEALTICHFDPATGADLAAEGACSRACYRCLLSYSNQTDHRLLNRFGIRDFLISLQTAATTRLAHGRTYEEQYGWLLERRDTASSLELRFLDELHKARHRLPDLAQFRPEQGVYAEADFFYEREDLKGIVVFVDGPTHDEPKQKEQDSRERRKLEDMGYRVILIRYDKQIRDQISAHADVFGRGLI
jgi:very-short-patch-repair endonuclease